MVIYILEQKHEGLGNSISFNVIENIEVIGCLIFFRTSRMDGGALWCLCCEAASSVHTLPSKCYWMLHLTLWRVYSCIIHNMLKDYVAFMGLSKANRYRYGRELAAQWWQTAQQQFLCYRCSSHCVGRQANLERKTDQSTLWNQHWASLSSTKSLQCLVTENHRNHRQLLGTCIFLPWLPILQVLSEVMCWSRVSPVITLCRRVWESFNDTQITAAFVFSYLAILEFYCCRGCAARCLDGKHRL